MNENELKRALDGIEPERGAQERMYANILKKAAARKESPDFAEEGAEISAAPQTRRTAPAWQRWGALAACLALVVIAAGLLLPRFLNTSGPGGPDESGPPPVLGGSPFEDVPGARDFEKLGFTIDAPEGAGEIRYYILNGEIAQVVFSLDGQAYTYRAAKLDGDFSGVYGEPVGSVSLDAEYNAVLDRLSPDTWRAHWSRDGISFYLTSVDGAEEEAVTAAVRTLLGKN